ncbi:MAG TPA: glycosyltransferase family 2 protein, partial [Candidatus Eremiobacteraceae bacterium]|nr:glycosyltransferase family 2 protein [Candidatus Eremiobacteraceae bacterium]
DLSDVTFVVLTKDEERNVAACLATVPRGAASLVYDADSSDRTREIAASMGARVAQAPWRGFAVARTCAEALIQTPWLFILDADERVTDELAAELQRLEPPDQVDAYTVPRANYFCGRWIRGAGWWPDRQIRLYRKGKAQQTARDSRSRAAGHVYYEAPGRTGALAGAIVHFSYASVDDYRRRFARYTNLEASAAPSTWPECAAAWAVMPVRAAWLLVGRRGLLDGWRGIYVSVASALYPAVVATKALSNARERST